MGLFTAPSSALRRPTSSAPLKRRSLGGKATASKVNSETSTHIAPLTAGSSSALQSFEPEAQRSAASSSDHPFTSSFDAQSTGKQYEAQSSREAAEGSDEEQDLDLADLQSDTAFLYDRHAPLDSALGLNSHQTPESPFLERIEAYVAEHYLDSFGITHRNELINHHNRLVPFHAKAPRFLSIHSLKRKELERDFTEVPDTVDTCARKQRCLGRCLLGSSCTTLDLLETE